MAKTHLTERMVKAAEGRPGKDALIFDDEIGGFALCIYASGNRAFVLVYRIAGRQRRYTIGSWPDWSVTSAREEAKALKRRIDQGDDPLAERIEAREAPTVRELINQYIKEHLPKLAKRNAADQESMLRKLVEPEWGARKVAEITPADVDRLLRKIAKGRARPHKEKPKTKRRKPLTKARPTPVRANRVGEVLRKMFNLAIKPWKMRDDNPAAGFARNTENERETFLTPDQIGAIAEFMAAHENRRAADVIRFILLTGARLGEALNARFDDFNLDLAIWTKPATGTKQRKMHRVPLSREAVAFITARRRATNGDWLFPGDVEGQPLREIRRFWNQVRKHIGMPHLRIHDLRHTFASLLVSGGMSLPMIGKLLGHSQAKTTQRYAHLYDDPLRQGVDRIGDLLRPKLRIVDDTDHGDDAGRYSPNDERKTFGTIALPPLNRRVTRG